MSATKTISRLTLVFLKMIGLTVMTAFVQIIAYRIINLFAPEGASLISAQVVSILPLMKFVYGPRLLNDLQIPRFKRVWLGSLILAFTAWFSTWVFLMIYTVPINPSIKLTWVVFAAQVVTGPIIEEIIFRHWLSNKIAKYLPTDANVVLTTTFFTLWHLPTLVAKGPDFTMFGIIRVALLSLILTTIYQRWRSLTLVIALHGLWNLMNLMLTYHIWHTINMYPIINVAYAVLLCVFVLIILIKSIKLR